MSAGRPARCLRDVSPPTAMRAPVFYGWWMVAACLVVAIVAWGLGLFGSSVYLHAVTEAKGCSIGLVSSASAPDPLTSPAEAG